MKAVGAMQSEFDEFLPEDDVREAAEIATRALALFAVVGVACGAPKAEAIEWLRSESLWDALSPDEASFLAAEPPSERQLINASWRSEALLVLLWSIGVIDELPGLSEQCNPGDFRAVLPPFADISVEAFVACARRKSDEELRRMAESVMHSHWRARDARFNGRPIPDDLNLGIVQERHHGINWIIGYEGLPWDDVATDT